MNSKKFYFIAILLIISIFVVFSYILITIQNTNKTQDDYIKQYDKILSSENEKICTVNNEEITDRDVLLVKYYDSDNANRAEEQVIENKVLLQRIKENDLKLEERREDYIQDIIYGLKNDSDISKNYSKEEKNILLECISEKLYNDALIAQFKAEFISKLTDKTFSTDNEKVLEKYNEYLEIKEKWDNQQGISYGKLWEAKEAVYKVYVQNLIDNSVIEY